MVNLQWRQLLLYHNSNQLLRKLHPPPEPRCETPKEKSKPVVEDSPQTKTVANDVKSSPQPAPVTPSTSTTNHTAPLTPCLAIITSECKSGKKISVSYLA